MPPKLPVVNPTTIFNPVIMIAAIAELPATERFPARINSDGEIAGLPDMLALSTLNAGCVKEERAQSHTLHTHFEW